MHTHKKQQNTINKLSAPAAYLEQPGPELAVQHHIKAEHLEADTIGRGWLSRAAHPCSMQDVWVSDKHGLDDHVSDVTPQEANIVIPVLAQVVVEEGERALTPRLRVVRLDVFVAVLVHRVVGQVHKQVVLE